MQIRLQKLYNHITISAQKEKGPCGEIVLNTLGSGAELTPEQLETVSGGKLDFDIYYNTSDKPKKHHTFGWHVWRIEFEINW